MNSATYTVTRTVSATLFYIVSENLHAIYPFLLRFSSMDF